MPSRGEQYKRLYGDKQTVVVEAIAPKGFVKIRDDNGIHFVRVESFGKYFKKVEDKQ